MRSDVPIWSISCQVPIDTPRTAWPTRLAVNAARKIARNISLGGSKRMILEGDVFLEGESVAIQYCLLKVLCESRHSPAHESIKESKEKRLGIGGLLDQWSPSLSF